MGWSLPPKDWSVVPHRGEELSLEDLSRRDTDAVLHQVRARGLVAGVARHVVDGDGRASPVGAVRRAAVPGEAVVEHHLTLPDGAGDRLNALARGHEREVWL